MPGDDARGVREEPERDDSSLHQFVQASIFLSPVISHKPQNKLV